MTVSEWMQVPPSTIYEVPKPGTMDWRFTDEPQRALTEKTLARLAAYVAERRALVRPFFKSLDPHNNGHLPRPRFRQATTRIKQPFSFIHSFISFLYCKFSNATATK